MQAVALALVPDLSRERELWLRGRARVVGADAVGLGCLCGPVVAAAVVVPPGVEMIDGVRDSKLLTAAQREALVDEIVHQALALGVGAASVGEIERLNVRTAEILAMRRAIARLGVYDHVLVDGKPSKHVDFHPYTAIVDGDALCYSIASASVVAKVARDRFMQRLALRHPEYGWEHNVGYSTAEHREALRRLGPTPHHRRTYNTVKAALQPPLGLEDPAA